ncbi:hypothetical protein [Streptomyces sp. NPDC054794]
MRRRTRPRRGPVDGGPGRLGHGGRPEGDRALAERIGKLRRPSLSAWASNLLVRQRPEEVETLRLGEGVRRAAARAGHPVGDGVEREVAATLHAVLADPDAAREWATGRLVEPYPPTAGLSDVPDTVPRRSPASPAPLARQGRAVEKERRQARDAKTRARETARDADRRAWEAGRRGEAAAERPAAAERAAP